MTTGYWNTHKYTRRSVETDFKKFCGWDRLLSMANGLDQTTRELVATTFETGGRASEVLSLRPENFEVIEDRGILMVHRMVVLKHHKAKPDDRTFPILLKDPLVPYLLETVDNTKPEKLLFPYSYAWMYKQIRNIEKPEGAIHGPWWTHRFRAERATELVVESGFGVLQLMDWFGWKRSDTPTFYTKLSPEDLIKMILKE